MTLKAGRELDVLVAEPNRFDPFEALDEIWTASCSARGSDWDDIRRLVNALRAYIAGMEK